MPDVALNGMPAPSVWIPYTMLTRLRPADDYFADRRAQWLSVIGRRRPEYSQVQVQKELSVLSRRADEEVPGRVTTLVVTDGSLAQTPGVREKAALLIAVILGSTVLLLLLACVNVTTLLLSRSAARQREIAVRLSLGAGRLRLLRQLLTESLVLSGIATIVSLVISAYAPVALWNSLRLGQASFDMKPDLRVLLYCVAVAVATGLIAGLSPATESLRLRIAESLKGSSATVATGRRGSRLRNTLVALQVALSLLVLVEATLFVRVQRNLVSYEPGFETKQVLSVTLASVLMGFSPPPAFYQDLESRVNAIPGVVETSYASHAPWLGRNSTELSAIDGKQIPSTRDYRRDPARRNVMSQYFSVLSIPLIQGRVFRNGESGGAVPVVISEAMAHLYWPNQVPVGRTFQTGELYQVVGICRDIQSVRMMQDDGPFYYAPLKMSGAKPSTMMVRVSGDPKMAVERIRAVVKEIDPQMAATIVPLSSMIDRQAEAFKPALLHGAIAGSLALLLALTGIYGVVSFSVSQRIPEIGIRLALGAQRRDILSLVLRSGMAPVLAGVALGIGLAFGAAAVTKFLLEGVNQRDPMMFTAVPFLLAAALGAIWIPARRAAALDPLLSLRHE